MTGRDRILLTVLAAVAVLAGFWFVVLGPKREEAKQVSADVTTARTQLETAQSAVAAAVGAKKRFPADYATVAKLGKAVPADDDMPSLLVQLADVAHGAKVDFQSLKLAAAGGAPAASSAGSGASTAAGSSTSSGASTAAGSSTGTGAAAAATQTATAALPPGATVGTAGLATMPFSFVFDGSYFDLTRFLGDVQGFVHTDGDSVSVSGRLLAVNGISLQPGPKGFPQIEATISATSYLQPDDQSTIAGAAAPSGSAATGTDTGTGAAGASAPTSSAIGAG